jgi:hypothetical protein
MVNRERYQIHVRGGSLGRNHSREVSAFRHSCRSRKQQNEKENLYLIRPDVEKYFPIPGSIPLKNTADSILFKEMNYGTNLTISKLKKMNFLIHWQVYDFC